jgi:hypothetical protein
MTSGSPSPALRQRVRARIEPPAQRAIRRRRARLVWTPALAVGATAVLVFLVTRQREPLSVTTQETSSPPEVVSRSEAAGSPVVAVVEPGSAGTEPTRSVTTVRRSRRAGEIDSSSAAENDFVTPLEGELPPIERIAIERVTIEPVPLDLAVIERIPEPMPLRIERLQMQRFDLQ